MQYIFVCICSISALKSHYFFSKKTKHWPEQVNALIWLTQCIVLTDTMHRLYFANESPFIPQWIAFTLRRKRLSFFNGTRMSSEWWAVSDEGVGTLRAASEVSYSHNSRQSRQRLRAKYTFVRFVCDYNPMCFPDAARRRPYLLTTHHSLLTAHCSLLIAHCSSLIAHCSSLIAHCSSPICQKTRKVDFRVMK